MYIGCEKEKVKLRCSDKTAPEIESATWGLQDGAVCPTPTQDAMSCSDDVTEIVKGKCNAKKCVFRPNKNTLIKPCDGTGTPIIKIEYKCPGDTTEAPTPTCKYMYYTVVLNCFSVVLNCFGVLFLISYVGTAISHVFLKY